MWSSPVDIPDKVPGVNFRRSRKNSTTRPTDASNTTSSRRTSVRTREALALSPTPSEKRTVATTILVSPSSNMNLEKVRSICTACRQPSSSRQSSGTKELARTMPSEPFHHMRSRILTVYDPKNTIHETTRNNTKPNATKSREL